VVEDEIDLRDYIDVLVRRWKWIVGVTILAALAAGVVSFATPPVYEATATLAVLQSSNPALVSPAAQLAVLQSSNVATQTLQWLGENAAGENASTVARRVRVVADAQDKTLFRVTAQSDTPQKAAAIANAWANAGTEAINQVQDQSLSQAIPMLQQDVDRTGKDLQAAEENLKRMQRDLQIDLLTQQLARAQQILNSQFAERENVKVLLAQAQTLRQQVQQGQISLSPEMLLTLQATATTGGSFLIQPSQFVTLTKPQQLDQLDEIIAALNGRHQALSTSIDSVSVQVTMLQQQLNEKQTALIEPTRARDTARANYDSATAKLRDAQARLAQSQNQARVVSHAVAPDSPTQPKPLQNVAIAAVVGLMIAVGGAFAFEYFAQPRKPRAT